MQLDDVIGSQKSWKEKNQAEKEKPVEELTYLQITVNGSDFLFPIHEVREVAEMPYIRHYPIQNSGHLGVVNLRGNVVPLLSMKCFFQEGENSFQEGLSHHRLVVLYDGHNEVFGVGAESVKKIVIRESVVSLSKTLTLNERPAQLTEKNEILKKWGILPC
jgi:chemotaxis signal transduction protein